jgi:hypothetical protein
MIPEIVGTTREAHDPPMEAYQKLIKNFPKIVFNKFFHQMIPEIVGNTREFSDPPMEAYQKLMKIFPK